MMQEINGVFYSERKSDAEEGFAVRPAKGQNRPVLLICHGIGERGAGLLPNLVNLIDGFDYDGAGPLPRQYAFENSTIEAFAAKYDFHLVTVNYPDSFQPGDFSYVFTRMAKEFSIDQTRIYIAGFSLGGGAILKKVTASVTDAASLAGAIAAAPVNWATTHKNVVDARLQVIGTTCEIDDTVSPGNIKDFVSKVNALKPEFPAHLVIYPGRAHSGFNEILAEENTWKWMGANSTTNRIAFTRSTTSTPTKPVDPVPTTPATDVVADFNIKNNQVISTTSFELDASASKGAKSYYWKVERAEPPFGVGPKWDGGTVGGPKKKISGLTAGMHTVQLEINGSIKSDVRVFVVRPSGTTEPEPTPKTVVSVSAAKIVFSDGTTADSDGWKLVGKSGEEYVL